MSRFERAVGLASAGSGRYQAVLDPAWNGPVAPNGGLLAAIMVRAVEAELGPSAPPPRTVAAHFLEVPGAGPVEVTVGVLRRGKRVACCEVRMHEAGRVFSQATIVCSAERDQVLALAREPPAVPPPHRSPRSRWKARRRCSPSSRSARRLAA
jgi:acyl-CoA thioesterase